MDDAHLPCGLGIDSTNVNGLSFVAAFSMNSIPRSIKKSVASFTSNALYCNDTCCHQIQSIYHSDSPIPVFKTSIYTVSKVALYAHMHHKHCKNDILTYRLCLAIPVLKTRTCSVRVYCICTVRKVDIIRCI